MVLGGIGSIQEVSIFDWKGEQRMVQYCELAVESSQHLLFSCNGIASELKF